jgi:hypothetical protein
VIEQQPKKVEPPVVTASVNTGQARDKHDGPAESVELLFSNQSDVYGFAAAIAAHAANVSKLHRLLLAGSLSNAKDSASAAWRTVCKALLNEQESRPEQRIYALSPTNDSEGIARARGKPDQRAFFGMDQPVPYQAVYSSRQDRRIVLIDAALVTSSEVGYRHPKTNAFAIINPSKHSDEAIQQAILKAMQPRVSEAPPKGTSFGAPESPVAAHPDVTG